MKQSWEVLQYGKERETKMGLLKWRPGTGGFEELQDAQKILLARGKMPGTFRRKPCILEVFVTGDDLLLELILASWFATIEGLKGEERETSAVAEVIGALGGG